MKMDLREIYSSEITNIINILDDLENNRIYEISGAMGDGNLSTNIQKLRKDVLELLYKIDNGIDGELSENALKGYFD